MSLLNELAEKNSVVAGSDAYKRITALFDEGSFNEIDAFAGVNSASGVVCGYGTVCGMPVYAFSQNKDVLGGAVGAAEANKIKKVYDFAVKTGAPVVGIYDSNGAKLAEEFDALGAYGDMLLWSNNISGVVPQVSVIAGTCAGTAAMVACGADVVVMSEKAELFMTAPSVLKASEKWEDEIATASACAQSGVVHLTAEDDMAAVAAAKDVISRLPMNNLSDVPAFEFSVNADAAAVLRAASEDIDSVDMTTVISSVADADSVVYLQAEYGDGAITALGTLEGSTVGFVGLTDSLFIDECTKASRFVRFCDAFAIPVVTFINSCGFEKSILSENGGILKYATMLSHAYAEATTVKVAVVAGRAYGALYVAAAGRSANADMVLAWPNAVISALEPDAAVAILMNDRLAAGENRDELVKEYCTVNASPLKAAQSGKVDDIIDAGLTREKLAAALSVMSGKRVTKLPKKHSNMPL